MGEATFGEMGQVYDALAEPTAGPTRLDSSGPLSEAALAWREKRTEFGLGGVVQTTLHMEGQVQETAPDESSQPRPAQPTTNDGHGAPQSSQPAASWGAVLYVVAAAERRRRLEQRLAPPRGVVGASTQ